MGEYSTIELLPEWPIYGFKVKEVPFELLCVPKPERCVRISKRCKFRAVVCFDDIQFCESCYIELVRATMRSYHYYLQRLDGDFDANA